MMRKKRYFLGLIALMAIVALGFTACPDETEYPLTFMNYTPYRVRIDLANASDKSFTLDAFTNTAGDPPEKTVTITSKSGYGYSNADGDDDWLREEKSDTGLVIKYYKSNKAPASILRVEE